MMQGYRNIALFLFTMLFINPAVLFLLTDSAILTIMVTVAILGILALIATRATGALVYFINFSALFGLLLYAELIFTYSFSDYVIKDLYDIKQKHYFNKPFLRERFEDKEYIVDYVTNAQGFRIGAQDDQSAKVELVDWLFIGDSYTQGAQVDHEQLFTSLLYKDFPNKIILNVGVSGFGLSQELSYFKSEGRRLRPKKVFLQICNFNDFMKVTERQSDFSDYLMNYSNLYRSLIYPFKFENPAELPLGRWTEPFYPTQKQNTEYNIFYRGQSEAKKKDLETFEKLLIQMAEAVHLEGAELVVLQIPTKEQLYFRYLQEVVNGFKIDVRQLDMTFPNRFLKSLCEKRNIRHVDLFEKFSEAGKDVFFEYDEHLNPYGHQILASALADVLRSEKSGIDYLSQNNASDRYPSFNNDGSQICFQSLRDGNMELFVADPDLERQTRLTYNRVDELHPSFFDNESKLIFTEGDQEQGDTKIAWLDLQTKERGYWDNQNFGAIPSVDSRAGLAYAKWTKDLAGRMTTPVLAISSVSGKSEKVISSDRYESWRPVQWGDSIIYISKRKGVFGLYMYSRKTESETVLKLGPGDIWDPNFSPDGRHLVFSMKENNQWDLFLMNLYDRRIVRLTNTRGDEWDPTFSPDGRYIYFAGIFGLRNGIYRLPVNVVKNQLSR